MARTLAVVAVAGLAAGAWTVFEFRRAARRYLDARLTDHYE